MMMNRFRVFVGPVHLDEYAEMFQAVPGLKRVSMGTEHVYFDYDGSLALCRAQINTHDDDRLCRVIQTTAQLPGLELFWLDKS